VTIQLQAIHLGDNYTVTFENVYNIIFHHNNASLFGGAIYGELKQANQSKILSTNTGIDFSNNTALVGDDVYIHIHVSCDETCLNSSMVGHTIIHLIT